jgi:putative membrane protein
VIQQLLWSLTNRPYVTVFLFAFLALSWLEQGRLRTLIWLASGYLVALAAEWGSINHGIPFGRYVYHYEHLENDLVVFGVPFFDSLSFSFLSYVSFSFAQFFMSPLWMRGYDVQRVTSRRLRNSTPVLLLGAMLMVVIDLIVDPIAHLGKHWFLGDIYHYPEPGVHFGVTLANYGGWFLVASITIFLNQRIDERLAIRERENGGSPKLKHVPLKGLFAPCFWGGIVVFQLGVTYCLALGDDLAIDHERLKLQAITGTFIIAPILALAAFQPLKRANRVSHEDLNVWFSEYPCHPNRAPRD